MLSTSGVNYLARATGLFFIEPLLCNSICSNMRWNVLVICKGEDIGDRVVDAAYFAEYNFFVVAVELRCYVNQTAAVYGVVGSVGDSAFHQGKTVIFGFKLVVGGACYHFAF